MSKVNQMRTFGKLQPVFVAIESYDKIQTKMRKVKIEQSEWGGYHVYIDGSEDYKVFRGSLIDDTPRPKWYTEKDPDNYDEPDEWDDLEIEWIAGCFLKKSTIDFYCGCCSGTVYEGLIIDEETFNYQIESEL